MKRVLTVTINPALDLFTHVDRLVDAHKMRCAEPLESPRGGGLNVARAVANLGGEVTALYLAGGTAGLRIKELLEAEGIAMHVLAIAAETRINFAIRDDSSERQYRFVMLGPHLSEGEWQSCLDAAAGLAGDYEFVVASGSLPPGVPADFYARLARLAKAAGARFVLDTSGEALKCGLAEGVYLVKPSEGELSEATGASPDSESELSAAAADLVRRGAADIVAVTRGENGVLLATAKGIETFAAPIVPVVNTLGAGDAFVAGTVLGLARDWPLGDSVRYGIAAATATVQAPGTQLCSRAESDAIYAKLSG
jgi:6-phosphofructokinase 2